MLGVMESMHKILQEFIILVTFRNMCKTYDNLKIDLLG